MSTISYANVVATGSASPTSQSDPSDVNAASITASLNEVATTEKTDEQALPSPTPSPKAEKVKKEIQLAPAPVPEVNAWGSANSSRSNSNVTVDTKYWPSPLETPQPNGATFNKKIAATKSSKEKWVPFKASVVLAEPNANKKHGQKRNGQKNAVNNQKPNENKSRKNKSEKRAQHPKDHTNQQQSKQLQQHKEESQPQPKPEVASTSQEQEQESEISTQTKDELGSTPSQEHKQKHHAQGNHQSHRPFNKTQHQHQPQGQQQQFNHNFVPQLQQNQFYPPNQQFNRPPRTFNNNTRRYNKFNNTGFIRNNNVNGYQHRRSFNDNPYASYENVDPLFHLIKQVQYYFSPENLVKDLYLRKQMNDDGWLPLNVIANFYRMKVLSLGDFNLIRNSIDELNGTVLEIAEFEDSILKVRSKENYAHWVLPITERDVTGTEESKFIKLITKKAPEPSTEEPTSIETKEAAPTEEENQETTA